jgi:hypothetical protein
MLLAGVGQARAQIHNQNYQKLNSQFSPGSAMGTFLEPDQLLGSGMSDADGSSSHFVGRLPTSLTSQLNTGFSEKLPSVNQGVNSSRSSLSSHSFGTQYSPLNGDMSDSPMWRSNFPLGRNFPINMAPTSGTRQPLMSSNMQRISKLNDATAYNHQKTQQTAPDKFTDAFVFHTTDNSKQLAEVGKQLSLQDINRYQFQGSFSGEPGLPITRAAGDASQVSATGGSLSKGPKLFEFAPSQGNSVPSGGSVAPRIITSEGSRPYLPTKQNSLGASTSLTKSTLSSSNSSTPSSAPSSSSSQSNTDTAVRGEIPKHEAFLPQGKYQYTTPSGSKLPVELDAPEVIIENDN